MTDDYSQPDAPDSASPATKPDRRHQKAWNRANRLKMNGYLKAWREKNRVHYNAQAARYRRERAAKLKAIRSGKAQS